MDIPWVPIVAFIGAAGLFGYQLRQYLAYKKKQKKPSIPNFTATATPISPQEMFTTVAVPQQNGPSKQSSHATTTPKPQKKKSYALYYAVVSVCIITVGIIAFSMMGQQKMVYIPRADEGISPTSPLQNLTPTAEPTPTGISVTRNATPTSISGAVLTPSATTSTPSITLPTPTTAPTPRVGGQATPTLPTATPTVAKAQVLLTPTPTRTLIAQAPTLTPTAYIPATLVTKAPTPTLPVVTTTTGPTKTTIPQTGIMLWPVVLVALGGVLLLFGLVF